MKLDGVVLGRLISVPLVRHHVHQRHGARGISSLSERHFKLLEVVAVNGSQVLKPHLRPEHRRYDHAREPG